MGRVLVLFDTSSGNTGKMAALVAQGAESVPGTEVRLLSIEAARPEDLRWCDGLAVGSPTNMGAMSWKMKRFWDEAMADEWGKVDGKIACAFSSSGGWGGGAEIACLSTLVVLMNFGFLVFGVTDYVGKQFTLHYGSVVAGEPRSEKEVDSCRKLGERLAQWVAALVTGDQAQHPLRLRELAKE
ncbi:MAG TPA: flavodoxin domain-containing protein [Armatimonadota bacterium]|jgi:NAD(P)H dehydrogenase (quinone)